MVALAASKSQFLNYGDHGSPRGTPKVVPPSQSWKRKGIPTCLPAYSWLMTKIQLRARSSCSSANTITWLSIGVSVKRRTAFTTTGVYEITLNVPESGVYLLFVESPLETSSVPAIA
jgi:hypothetical protein